MAQFFGAYLEKKPYLNRTVLTWLEKLPDTFYVFVEVEGSDFQTDFLVIKQDGIFNVEAKDWRLREAREDGDWILEDGAKRPDPFLKVLDQCDKVRDYILFQRHELFGEQKAKTCWDFRGEIKVFPVVAVSHPNAAAVTYVHRWRKLFTQDDRLRRHLIRFEWFPEASKPFCFEPDDVLKLADLFHLVAYNPRTLVPVGEPAATKVPPVPIGPAIPRPIPSSDTNPYQYTDPVTGVDFYGRERELLSIKRALESVPRIPVMIMGLQRTGKSSLAREGIRRVAAGAQNYTAVEYNFRRLRDEGLQPHEDIALLLLKTIARDTSSALGDGSIEKIWQAAAKSDTVMQRRLFPEALKWNTEHNRRTILFLDECQDATEFLNQDRILTFFGYLDSLCHEPAYHLNVILAFRPAFLDLEPVKKINLGRLFETITLGRLDERAARALIDRGASRLHFDEGARERLLAITGRHPYWLQLLCHRVFNTAVDSNDFVVHKENVDSVFEAIVKDPGCKPQFLVLYQDVETNELAFDLLQDLCEAGRTEGGAILIAELKQNPKWADRNRLRNALKVLVDNQVVAVENVPDNPAVRFCVEALRAWMRPNLITL